MPTGKPGTQAGMSLVEVMVAVFVLAAGLLGLAALQTRSLAYAQTSFYRSIAADLAADLADRIRANRPPFYALDNSFSPAVRPPVEKGLATVPDLSTCAQLPASSGGVGVTGCPAVFNVQNDMNEWDAALRAQLPGGTWAFGATPQKVVATGQDPAAIANIDVMGWRYTLTITWIDDRNKGASDAGYTASYVTVIE